jgi:hypothetical protein
MDIYHVFYKVVSLNWKAWAAAIVTVVSVYASQHGLDLSTITLAQALQAVVYGAFSFGVTWLAPRNRV